MTVTASAAGRVARSPQIDLQLLALLVKVTALDVRYIQGRELTQFFGIMARQ